MGTASFSVGVAAQTANGPLQSSTVRVSGAFTTSGTADDIQDSTSTDIEMAVSEIIQIHASVAMRVSFGGVAATTSTGHYIPEGQQREYVCQTPGKVSIIDV